MAQDWPKIAKRFHDTDTTDERKEDECEELTTWRPSSDQTPKSIETEKQSVKTTDIRHPKRNTTEQYLSDFLKVISSSRANFMYRITEPFHTGIQKLRIKIVTSL
jgi:hypothetical protein